MSRKTVINILQAETKDKETQPEQTSGSYTVCAAIHLCCRRISQRFLVMLLVAYNVSGVSHAQKGLCSHISP